MAFSLKIITPERLVMDVQVTSVTLPTALGEIEILDGHLPIIGIIEAGTLTYRNAQSTTSIAIDTGFFKLLGSNLEVLTEAAIDVNSMDEGAIDEAVKRAKEALEKAKTERQLDEEELDRLDKILRFKVAQKLTKTIKH